MESARIAELLQPFLAGTVLPAELVEHVQSYLDLVLRWNARVNLTAVRDPEQIIRRHFGESFFAARTLLGDATSAPGTLADIGSGAGFPGIPIKLWAPQIRLDLIESHNKKATFLREVIRSLKVEQAEVFCGRAEQWGKTADVVTLRAVEKFERVLPAALRLIAGGGRLCLLIGAKQVNVARRISGSAWRWHDPVAIPLSTDRVVAIARAM